MRGYDDELLLLQAEFYCALWNLIRAGFSHIRQRVTNFLFETDLEVLYEILDQHAEDALSKRASDHFRVDSNEIMCLLQRMQVENLEPDEAQEILANPLVLQKSWLYEIYPALTEASQEDEQIATLLAELDLAWVEEASARSEFLSKRHGSGKVFKSHEWNHGKKELLCKGSPPYKK